VDPQGDGGAGMSARVERLAEGIGRKRAPRPSMLKWREEVLSDGVRLILGDCRDVLPTLGRFDAIVTDPPYEFDAEGAGIFRSNRKCMDQILATGLDQGFDHTILTAALCDSVVCFCHNDQLVKLISWLEGQFGRYAVCMWHKVNPMPVANRHYKPDTELYVHAWNGKGYPIGQLEDKSRYTFAPVGKSDFAHPTVKPLRLMEKVIRNVQGNLILDPFCGSGSTGVAAVRFGRRFTGIEIEPKYHAIACRRIEDELRRPRMFVEQPATAKQEALL